MLGNLEISEYSDLCTELSTTLWGMWGKGDIRVAPLILNLRARWR